MSTSCPAPGYALRPRRPEDGELVFEIFLAVRPEIECALRTALGPHADACLRQQAALRDCGYQAEFANVRWEIVSSDGRDVGILATSGDAKTMRLVDLEILPECQGQGIGTQILKELSERARAEAKLLRLSVERSNFRGRALYERLGFCVCRETATHFTMELAA